MVTAIFETRTRLVAIIAEQLCQSERMVHDHSRLREDLGADSLDPIEIAMTLEDRFNVDVSAEEVGEVHTFGELVVLVDRKVSAARAA